jgi:2-dehydropantoate 2-reductase
MPLRPLRPPLPSYKRAYRNIPGVRLRPVPLTSRSPSAGVHILGLGSLGKLVAHSLRTAYPSLPITVVFRRWAPAVEFERAGSRIRLRRGGGADGEVDVRGGFEYEVLEEPRKVARLDVRNLVVATKTYDTRGAVAPFVGRLSPASSVLFLQNGLGELLSVPRGE